MVKYRDRHELNEHAQIKEAVLARDSEKAVRLLREHFTATLKILSETGSFE